MDNKELAHHGVLGMKWGVRRYQNKDGTRTTAGKQRDKKSSVDKEVKQERKAEVKKRRSMTDVDLRKRIDRLKLEREYKSLTDSDIAPGRKFVSEILSSGGKKALTIAAAGAISYGIKAAMTKKFNLKEAAEYVAANPNKKK